MTEVRKPGDTSKVAK